MIKKGHFKLLLPTVCTKPSFRTFFMCSLSQPHSFINLLVIFYPLVPELVVTGASWSRSQPEMAQGDIITHALRIQSSRCLSTTQRT